MVHPKGLEYVGEEINSENQAREDHEFHPGHHVLRSSGIFPRTSGHQLYSSGKDVTLTTTLDVPGI